MIRPFASFLGRIVLPVLFFTQASAAFGKSGAPRLTFFSELESKPLAELFSDDVVAQVKDLNARISLGVLDLSEARAAVVRRLNRAGIPVTAWLLVSREEGYWANLHNLPNFARRYDEFKAWTARHDLKWDAVAFDIEPDIRHFKKSWPKLIREIVSRSLNWNGGASSAYLKAVESAYRSLAAQIKRDGFRFETYTIPVIADERAAQSDVLRRSIGLVEIPSDREVPMLYSNLMRQVPLLGNIGAGSVWSYGRHDGVAIGVTGGGIEESRSFAPLTWSELARDLQIAKQWTSEIYIFSLEGCVAGGLLEKLKTFDWNQPYRTPRREADRVQHARTVIQKGLSYCPKPMN